MSNIPVELCAVYGITEPYTTPYVMLPPNAQDISTDALSYDTMRRVTRLTNTLAETLHQQQYYLVPLTHLRQQIVVIRAILMEIYERTYPDLEQLTTGYSLRSNRDIQEATLPAYDMHHVGGYIIYDEYFKIIRVPRMTTAQLLCHCCATTYEVLGDLPYTMLAREEIEVLFTASHKLFTCFLTKTIDSVPPVPAAIVMAEHRKMQAIEYLWNSLVTNHA